MMLTGKAKEDFIIWLNNLEVAPYEVMLDSIPKSYLYALIIDWFFTKDLFINTLLDEELNLVYCLTPIQETCFLKEQMYSNLSYGLDKCRCEKEAMEKANEIYNNLNQ